jgi:hypothetical protein
MIGLSLSTERRCIAAFRRLKRQPIQLVLPGLDVNQPRSIEAGWTSDFPGAGPRPSAPSSWRVSGVLEIPGAGEHGAEGRGPACEVVDLVMWRAR